MSPIGRHYGARGSVSKSLRSGATLVHEEHKPVTFVPGVYKIVIERERDPFSESIKYVHDFGAPISSPFVKLIAEDGQNASTKHLAGRLIVDGSKVQSPSVTDLNAGENYSIEFGAIMKGDKDPTVYIYRILCRKPEV